MLASAAIFALTVYVVLLRGTVANLRVRVANLEMEMAHVQAMQRATSRHAVECN